MSINWEEYAKPAGDYVRWKPENEGDTIKGVITSVRVATMPDGNKYPSLTVDRNGEPVEVLVSQSILLRLMAEKKPNVGDTIEITHTKVEKLAGNKTLKHFEVVVTQGAPLAESDIF